MMLRCDRVECVVRLLVMILLLPLLGACGSDDDAVPVLSALPTRTPAPPTVTPAPDDTLANLEIVSLREGVLAFLDAAADGGVLDRPVLFDQYVFAPHPECFSNAYYSDATALELFDFGLVSLDLDVWRAALDVFPEVALIDQITAMFTAAAGDLPLDAPFHVCILPAPIWNRWDGSGQGSIFQVTPLSGDLMVVLCGDEDTCLQDTAPSLAYAYDFAVQMRPAAPTLTGLTLSEHALFNARADDFAHHLYPDALFDWNVTLTAAQETDLWARMVEYLDVTYTSYPDYRKVDLFLYGKGNALYPEWGGLVIGTNIIRAFHENNPYVSYLELAQMPVADVLETSGYRPGSG